VTPIHPSTQKFWAKLGTAMWPETYHPVVCHLIDVGQVAAALWRDVLREQLRTRVAAPLGLRPDDAGRWVAFWVAAHDIGKVTPCFQSQGKSAALREQLKKEFDWPVGNKHHTETGTQILRSELVNGDRGWPRHDTQLAQKVAVTIGGHHGTFPPAGWNGIVTPLGDERWAEVRRDTLAHLARLFGVAGRPAPTLPPGGDQSVWMYLAGLTSVADWIGSNEAFFPRFVTPEHPRTDAFDVDAYFGESRTKADHALEELGWLDRRGAGRGPRSFEEATGIAKPRALQEAVDPIARRMAGDRVPQLIVVEAPMGEGKTEAAWYAADCWDRAGGQGTYVALPTMATSNQMFDRVGKFLAGREGKSNVMLLHGKAALNECFVELKKAARPDPDAQDQIYDDDRRPSGVVAEGWFAANKKHGLLAPFGVGTIDQALLAVLQTKHVFVRLFGLAGKCVILDEVHAYDAYMTTLMERLLGWLAALSCPVVLLSATLPADKRLKLLRAYAGDQIAEPAENTPYPRLTTAGVGDKITTVVPFKASKSKTIHLGWVEDGDLVGNIRRDLAAGGCAAVIRNTVGLAQHTYLLLKAEFGAEIAAGELTLELFHARFPFGRRKQIEDAVLAKYGKGADGNPANPLRPRKAIVVATQVIEQSLDLDFDVMVSDVAPVDLVLQRGGRLHRHERGERPAGVREPRVWLIEPGEKDGMPDFGPSEYVYARFVLLRSLVALRASPVVTLPGDLERLVEQVYGKELLDTPEHYASDLTVSESALREEQRKQNRAAKGVMIWRPDTEDLLEQQSQQLREDDPEAHKKIQAATRDTEPTIQLVLVYHRHGRDFLDPTGAEPFNLSQVPDVTRLRRILDNEVSISHRGCVTHYVREFVPPGWTKSGMLQHHRVVRLGEDGRSLTDEWIRVDDDLGVVIQRRTQTEGE